MRAGPAALVLALLLAGCSSSPSGDVGPGQSPAAGGDACQTDVRGVIVDEAIRPLADVAIRITGAGVDINLTTDAQGSFELPCLAPGMYFITASHPLFATAQGSFEVDGRGHAQAIRLQLQRVVFATPYNTTQSFDGFLVCSVGFSLYASEECGEGVGVPCEVPIVGCQRVGGQGNNRAQWDFWLDGPFVRELVVELTWEPTSPTFRDFYFVVATDWTCDPFCVGNELNVTTGGAPLRLTASFVDGIGQANTGEVAVTADTRFSTFVWPDWGHGDPTRADVAVNQPFEAFATAFYYLPAPPGYSFVAAG